MGFSFPLHIPNVPVIPYLSNDYNPLASNKTPSPTYEHLQRSIILPYILENKTVSYKKRLHGTY